MPKLEAIQAIRYAASHDGEVTRLIAPPYDVLDEGPKQALLDKNAHNIVKVDLPVTPPKTVGPAEAYEGAAVTFGEWVNEQVLLQDEQAAIYAYEEKYEVGGEVYRRRGFFAGVGVEEFGRSGGGIHRHEMTIKSGTDDRMLLMEATGVQMSPVFSMFSDADGQVMALLSEYFDNAEPDFVGVTPHDDVEHRVWVISEPAKVAELQGLMSDTDVFIADGHHRYTTALNYHEKYPEAINSSNCLMVLVPIEDPGMIVLATHRVIRGLEDFSFKAFEDLVKADDRLSLRATNHGGDGLPVLAEELPEHGPHAMGVYDPERGKTYVLSFVEDPLAEDFADKAAVWRQLDVAILKELVIDQLLKPNFGNDSVHNSYPHKLDAFVRDCHEESGRLGFVMQPTPLKAVCDVSLAGEVMPPKSTFFFPKLATGLVINPLK